MINRIVVIHIGIIVKWEVIACGHSLGLHHETVVTYPDSKVHGANMGPIWGRQDPGGPYVGPMDFAIWVYILLH